MDGSGWPNGRVRNTCHRFWLSRIHTNVHAQFNAYGWQFFNIYSLLLNKRCVCVYMCEWASLHARDTIIESIPTVHSNQLKPIFYGRCYGSFFRFEISTLVLALVTAISTVDYSISHIVIEIFKFISVTRNDFVSKPFRSDFFFALSTWHSGVWGTLLFQV